MRAISNWNTGFPNMRGGISPRAATLAQIPSAEGYATYATAKWHLAPMEECSAAGPHHSWPLQKGFDRFYGFLQGETDQFHPELTRDNSPVDPPARPEDGYHLSEDIVNEAIAMVSDLKAVRPDRPFFLYVAFGATHAPNQSPLEYRLRSRGAFDEGYETVRRRWYERQLELGIIPEGTSLAPPNPGVPAWEELSDAQRRFAAQLQEAFAAMLEHTDAQIGRLVSFLEERALLEDALVMVLSDNGASREGGPFGVMDELSHFNACHEDVEAMVASRLDDIGGPRSHSNYPWGWAQAGNSPLRWYKQNTYGGGVRDPLVVHWPRGIPAEQAGTIRRQFCHAIDLTPTVLDLLGIDPPSHHGGVPQLPMHGASIAETLADPSAPSPRHVQYFEQMGHRGLWADGWKAVTYHLPGQPFDNDEWALYDLSADFSECNDLAQDEPGRLRELGDAWWVQAGEHGVLPLDDRSVELFGGAPRAGSPHAVEEYVYRPPMSHIPAEPAPPTGGRNWTVAATVRVPEPGGAVEGVLFARGSSNVGLSFFVKDGRLELEYNALGTWHRASGPVSLGPGRHELGARFERRGEGGTLTISADGRDVGSAEVPRVVRLLGSTGLDIGQDRLSPVADDYEPPFAFTGVLERVVFRSSGRTEHADVVATARAEMAKE
jgi:arylsulfatase A-like enzyme